MGFYSKDIHSACTEQPTRRSNPTHHPSLCLQLVKVFNLPRGKDTLFIIAQETISCLFSLLPFPLPDAVGWCSLYSYGLRLWLWLHSLLEVFFPRMNFLIGQPSPSLVFVQGLLFLGGGISQIITSSFPFSIWFILWFSSQCLSCYWPFDFLKMYFLSLPSPPCLFHRGGFLFQCVWYSQSWIQLTNNEHSINTCWRNAKRWLWISLPERI